MRQALIEGGLQQFELFGGQLHQLGPNRLLDLNPIQRRIRLLYIRWPKHGFIRIEVGPTGPAEFVDAPIACDAENPGRDRRLLAVVHARLAPDRHHDVLRQILGLQRACAQPQHVTLHPRGVEVEQFRKRGPTLIGGNQGHAVCMTLSHIRGNRRCYSVVHTRTLSLHVPDTIVAAHMERNRLNQQAGVICRGS